MHRHALLPIGLIACLCQVALAEDIFRESFTQPGRKTPLVHTWGDKPASVAANATEAGAVAWNRRGTGGAHRGLPC